MPTITISRGTRDSANNPGRNLPGSVSGITGGAVGKHPKALLLVPGVATITLPFAPESVKLSGNASEFGTLDRPGRRPFLYKTGQPLRTLTFTCLFKAENDPQGQVVIEDQLRELQSLTNNGSNVFFFANLGYTEFADGKGWRCSNMDINPVRRQHGSNQITRATLDFTFLENITAYNTVGPLTGSA